MLRSRAALYCSCFGLRRVCGAEFRAGRDPRENAAFCGRRDGGGAVTLAANAMEIVEFHANGMADIEAGHPMRQDTIFRIMSMTKPVTAIGIMMLEEEGKLALRDSVEQFLPEFRNQRVAANAGHDSARLGTPRRRSTIIRN